ncbi:MAG: hypothetical protein WBB29_07870 [Geitlerinemataceae cyanobacterium]
MFTEFGGSLMRLLSNSFLSLSIFLALSSIVKSPDRENAKFQDFTTPKLSPISIETKEANPCDFHPKPCQPGGTLSKLSTSSNRSIDFRWLISNC